MSASTPASMPRLSEAARHLVIPSTIVESVWPRIRPRLEAVGTHFDPWQQGFATVALGLDSRSKYAATIGGVVATIPRQVGKTFTVGSLLIGLALEFPGHRIIWTSHHGSTTKNTLQSMQGMVMRKAMRPFIRNVYTNNNDLRIVFMNGSVIMFGAREHGFGRGMDAIDILVFDEAQKLGLKALEDMVPATNQSRHEHGALVFFIGTPPRPEDNGESFGAKRSQALAGKSDHMVYVEFSADRGSDPMDKKQWRKANPSYPHRTPTDSMLRMRENIPDDDSWRREAMGIWDVVGSSSVIDPITWHAQQVADGPDLGARPDGLAVDASHDREFSVAACWAEGDSAHVEEVWASGDEAATLRWLGVRAGRRIPVLIDSMSPAASLIPGLRASGVAVRAGSSSDMAKACGLWLGEVVAGRLTHANQDSVTGAVLSATQRSIGNAGGWGWDRRDPSTNSAPLVAHSLARLAASSRRKSTGDRSSTSGRRAVVL